MTKPARVARPFTRRSSGELVADHLRRQIIAGELAPGQRLTQEDIATELGVSRVPVREALVILEQEGWVKMEMQRGGRVLPVETSISDNAEVWNLLFGLIARRAADRLTPELDERFAALASELADNPSAATIWDLCESYLDALFEAASAPPVARTLRRIRAVAIDTIFEIVPETVEISRVGTLAVIEAIRDRDGDAAVAAHDKMQHDCLHYLIAAFDHRRADERS